MIERIHAFRAALQDAAAEQHVPASHGAGLFAPSVREVYDMNYVRAEQPAPADELIAEAERLMEDYFHRRVILERADARDRDRLPRARLDGRPAPDHGAHARAGPARRHVDGARGVVRGAVTAARREVTVGEPWGDDEISSLLDEAKRLIMRAVPTRFFAAFADGEIAAYCELRSDGTVAQIEDVNTLAALPRPRARPRRRAARGRRGARDERASSTWRRSPTTGRSELYAKLGFDVVGERHFNTLLPAPADAPPRAHAAARAAARRRDAELRALGESRAPGIHDPT